MKVMTTAGSGRAPGRNTRSPPAAPHGPAAVQRSPGAAAGSPPPSPWWAGRAAHRGRPPPAGSRSAALRDGFRAGGRPARSAGGAQIPAIAAGHGPSAPAGTFAVLPRRLLSGLLSDHDRKSPRKRGKLSPPGRAVRPGRRGAVHGGP